MSAPVRTATLLGLLLMMAGPAHPRAAAQQPGLSVRITSPMGRTGLPGPIRIVAQVRASASTSPCEVRFFIDKHLLRAVAQAPYAVEWTDENPFEQREITVEATDALGHAASDKVVLEPFEVIETSDVSSVLLEAAVQDKTGRFVKSLPRSEFTLFENGVPQVLDLVNQETVGATFAMLIDSSSSMSRRMDFVQETAGTLAGYLTARDQMVIAPFSKALGALTGPTHDAATINEAIAAIHPDGGTAILDALAQISGHLEGTEGRRAIVLITDGYDENSTTTFEQALAAVKKAHATVYVVGIGGVAGISLKGERLLRRLAAETGGRSFFPSSDRQLAGVHDTLTEDVQNRYLITYTSKNQDIDGTWREIALKTSHPDYVVRTRPGYFAPAPPPLRPNIEFTATDSGGRYLDLTADDLEVVEDGKAQRIETFQEAVQPVSIVLALDASGSMRHKEAEVIDSARRFVDALRPEDKLAIVLFADKAQVAQDLSTDRDVSHTAIKEYHATGGTALYDALADSLQLLSRAEGRRVVVVMTDGRDENNPGTAPGSVRTLADVLKEQKASGVTIFGIGLGTKVDAAPLERLASVSGGQALFPTEATDLEREYRKVVEDLRRRYVVNYTSSNPRRDGNWRDVQIRVKDQPEAGVRSVGGYFAPSR
jgi:Ca-activated chloride channel family protein